MLLTIRCSQGAAAQLLSGETERQEEFWFGQAFAWIETVSAISSLRLSLQVDVPGIVARTKRRDREDRFSIGFCDPYAYSAAGLMALFLASLGPFRGASGTEEIEIELCSYPKRPHSEAVARRLFSPLGYRVREESGKLLLQGKRGVGEALCELPALLLALDRRTRMFLTSEELEGIRRNAGQSISTHPALRAIELALNGRPTPLRLLLPVGTEVESGESRDVERTEFLSVTTLSAEVGPSVRIHDEQAKHAREMFSRMNIDRRWLIYLPAAVASLQRRSSGEELERPEDALRYYRDELVEKVVVEEKHMGSRGIAIVCRTSATAERRFGVTGEIPGCVYTRNGRRFFRDEDTEAVFLDRLNAALSRANFWKRFSTDWVCLDGEVLPWAVKAAESSEESGLVEAGKLVLEETLLALRCAEDSAAKSYWKNVCEAQLLALHRYDSMFKHYRTQENNLSALRFAPFHLIATDNGHFFAKSHLWHMQVLGRLSRSGSDFILPTRYETVSTKDPATWKRTVDWWNEISGDNSEGVVVKPFPFVPRGRRGLAQPALKCRTREHLRLVYGPQYDSEAGREALRFRDALLRRRNKHRRILQQFSLCMEAVDRFVQRKPIDAVHACIFGLLAQEVAPRMKT
jgi:hypothetical protein